MNAYKKPNTEAFEAFGVAAYEPIEQLGKEAMRCYQRHQPREAICQYTTFIQKATVWTQQFLPHLPRVCPMGFPHEWMQRLEDIRNRIRQFKMLLDTQQVQHPQRPDVNRLQTQVIAILKNYFYQENC